jgi:DNA end-binding protein Ku
VRDGVLTLATMLYADEVIATEDLDVPTAKDTKPSSKELDMATKLIESLTNAFDLTKYTDEHREKLLALIEAKADGEVVAPPELPEKQAPVVDLMAALEASLAAATKGDGKAKSKAS